MMHRTLILLAASVVVGVTSGVTTDALAKKGTAVSPASPPSATAPIVLPADGPPADRVPRCFDSVMRYPYPPCY